MGLIHHKVKVSELAEFTNKYATRLSHNAPLSIYASKIAIDEYLKGTQGDEDRIEAALEHCMESHDYQEGYQAFLEKRKPIFQGY